MKKKLAVISVLALCFAIAAGSTLAYFTDSKTAHNVITSGGVGITVVETTKNPDGTEVEFPKDGITGVMPGTAVSKIVSVKNTGESEAWIRVKVDTSMTNAENEQLPSAIKLSDGTSVDLVSFKPDTEKWTYQDGYYYYTDPVAAGESTAVLFSEVNFAPEMPNDYQNSTTIINVSAQAVQTANNGKTVTDAAGWPEE